MQVRNFLNIAIIFTIINSTIKVYSQPGIPSLSYLQSDPNG